MEKKIYKAPKMNVLQMKYAMSVLVGSTSSDEPYKDIDETTDPFGFNFNPSEHNRQA